ncbi:tartrate-resistant acid phosphatase type 5 family protein [Catenovulum sp. 2E275]|uniref:purple acid phosphatase family protein n=1 Tax=Catenovulum sp. 2E275 TaxID=2980497 RepID=UPI0021CF9B93|nr:tartrate-resistant acid phosphatase type 5 family protein [Catenovulum sp. 2E275]MCU4676792.1 tartrate-resistant acid phosphatase type 5 family protein [Catenovulum sp. 2E275]
MKLFKTSLVILQFVLLCTAHAALYKDELWYQQHPIKNLTVTENAINFIVVGDWGRNGHFQQKEVAEQMDNAMYWLDGDFIVSAGDNFYPDGIASVNDPYLKSSYEDIYSGPHLFEPWYVVLGNHDYRGNVQAQIDYSKISKRWNMPARYYSKTLSIPESSDELLLIFLDTNPFEAKYQTEEKYAAVRAENGQAQLSWLEQLLAGSTAKWKIVIGHHPMYSSGKRYGKTDSVRQKLEPILEKYKVQAYFAGHEHDLQHNQIKGKTVQHFISGAGSAVREVKAREFTEFAEAQAGFTALSVSQNNILVQMINAKGEIIYRTQIAK